MENSLPTNAIGERPGYIQTQRLGRAVSKAFCSRGLRVQDDGDDDTTTKAGCGDRWPDEPTKPVQEEPKQKVPSQFNSVTSTSFDHSRQKLRCKESLQDSMQPKILSQSDPLPLPRNFLSMYSTENASYSVAEAPRPDHPNDDRFFHCSNPGNNFKAFGVFDGYDGNNASDFASGYMEKYMEEIFLTKVGDDSEIKCTLQDRIEKTLCEMFIKTDCAFFRRIESVLKEKKQIRKALQV